MVDRLKNGTWYTLSFWAKGSEKLHTYVYPSVIDTSADFIVDGVKQSSRPVDGHVEWTLNDNCWRRHTVTFKTKALYATNQKFAANEQVLFRLMNQDYAFILMPKLEEGEQATAYQMNDEDIEGVTGKLLYPAGVYDSGKRYTSDEYTTPFVSISGTNEYYWLNADSSQGEDPRTSAKWRKANYFQVVIAEALVAAFGKIGAAVFQGSSMLSQYGTINGEESTEYKNFDETDPTGKTAGHFSPNLLLNFLTGNALINKGVFTGFVAKRKVTITPSNYSKYYNTDKDLDAKWMDLTEAGTFIEFSGAFTGERPFAFMPSIYPGSTNSQAYKERVRSLVGNVILIYNNATDYISITGNNHQTEEASGVSFAVYPGEFVRLECKCRATPNTYYQTENRGVEEIYWLFSKGKYT